MKMHFVAKMGPAAVAKKADEYTIPLDAGGSMEVLSVYSEAHNAARNLSQKTPAMPSAETIKHNGADGDAFTSGFLGVMRGQRQ